MNLVRFDKNQKPNRVQKARITFGANGTITLNAATFELMGIVAGDCVSFANDKDSPDDWYMYKDHVNGTYIKSGYKVGNRPYGKIFCRRLAREIRGDYQDNSLSCRVVSTDHDGIYSIITAAKNAIKTVND